MVLMLIIKASLNLQPSSELQNEHNPKRKGAFSLFMRERSDKNVELYYIPIAISIIIPVIF